MSAMDAGLIAHLAGDATLATLAPGGIWEWSAPAAVTEPYVIVQLIDSVDELEISGSGYEEATYLIKAVGRGTAGVAVEAAAARIHVRLQDARFAVTGQSLIACYRTGRVRYREKVGDQDWCHRGGLYLVMAG